MGDKEPLLSKQQRDQAQRLRSQQQSGFTLRKDSTISNAVHASASAHRAVDSPPLPQSQLNWGNTSTSTSNAVSPPQIIQSERRRSTLVDADMAAAASFAADFADSQLSSTPRLAGFLIRNSMLYPTVGSGGSNGGSPRSGSNGHGSQPTIRQRLSSGSGVSGSSTSLAEQAGQPLGGHSHTPDSLSEHRVYQRSSMPAAPPSRVSALHDNDGSQSPGLVDSPPLPRRSELLPPLAPAPPRVSTSPKNEGEMESLLPKFSMESLRSQTSSTQSPFFSTLPNVNNNLVLPIRLTRSYPSLTTQHQSTPNPFDDDEFVNAEETQEEEPRQQFVHKELDLDAIAKHIIANNKCLPSLISPGLDPTRSPALLAGRYNPNASAKSFYDSRNGPATTLTAAQRVLFYSDPSGPLRAESFDLLPLTEQKMPVLDLLRKGPFWIDVCTPTVEEMEVFTNIFGIHPLTTEDIQMEDTREKCEVFPNYYFITYRTFDADEYSYTFMQPINFFIIVFRECVLSFHRKPVPHPTNILRRIDQLKNYGLTISPDWLNYVLIDDITDGFMPLLRHLELEVDSIDDLVLILRESEQSDMLRRIGLARKRVTSLLRLLITKADVVKAVIKRCAERLAPESDTTLYLGDIQDHVITMVQNLNYCEKTLSRSHSNYLAQISIEITQASNRTSDVVMRMTALASILVPLNVITGLFGMNVRVPGEDGESLAWFFGIVCFMTAIACASYWLGRRYKLL